MEHVLEITDLKISTLRGKETVPLLDKVSLKVGRQQCLGIVGESGCGKSITASALLQLLPYPLSVTGGSAFFTASSQARMDLLTLPPKLMRGIRGREIAMIFQEPMTSLDPIFTIQQQMFEALHFHYPHMTHADRMDKSLSMLRKVNIPRPEQTLASYPHHAANV